MYPYTTTWPFNYGIKGVLYFLLAPATNPHFLQYQPLAGPRNFLFMSTFDASLLTSAEAASVRALHKSVCATQYEDPVDQDTFLVASARSVVCRYLLLQFLLAETLLA